MIVQRSHNAHVISSHHYNDTVNRSFIAKLKKLQSNCQLSASCSQVHRQLCSNPCSDYYIIGITWHIIEFFSFNVWFNCKSQIILPSNLSVRQEDFIVNKNKFYFFNLNVGMELIKDGFSLKWQSAPENSFTTKAVCISKNSQRCSYWWLKVVTINFMQYLN